MDNFRRDFLTRALFSMRPRVFFHIHFQLFFILWLYFAFRPTLKDEKVDEWRSVVLFEGRLITLFDEFLGLEILSEVEHLPRGQTEQAAHTENAEVKHPRVGAFVGVPHLFFPLAHVGEILDDAFA